MKQKLLFLITLYFTFSISAKAFSLANGGIEGHLTGAGTNEILPYGTVTVVGTSFGAVADGKGKYLIQNIPPGTYSLKATYIGYKTKIVSVVVKADGILKQDFKLVSEAVEGQTVVVTAQALGQNAAINQQLSALSIVNVVSAAKIQELPDANAAESVGRLPGVSVLREGGEGNKVVIRGLSPKYNVITIDGVRMAASDYNDRSSDLSMISPYSLEGIEVVKALTPDMDGDALGGTVNFKMRTAKEALGKEGENLFAYELMTQGGYNKIKSDYGNYNVVGSVSTRLFDSKLGIIGQVNLESRNRSRHVLNAGYFLESPKLFQFNQVFISGLSLNDVYSLKDRTGGNLVLDYKVPGFKVVLSNFYSRAKTRSESRGDGYYLNSNNMLFTMNYNINYLDVLTNVLSFEKDFSDLKIEGYVSNTSTKNDLPTGYGGLWVLDNAGLNAIDQKIEPMQIPKQISPDLRNVVIQDGSSIENHSKDQEFTGKLDLTYNYNLTDLISSNIKFGGRYRFKDRSYNHKEGGGMLKEAWGGGMEIRTYFQQNYPWVSSYNNWTALPLSIFQNNDIDNSNFLEGDYPLFNKGNFNMFRTVIDLSQKYTNGNLGTYIPYNLIASLRDNYSGNEYSSAGYLMATFKLGDLIQVIPGVRYESLTTSYTAVQGDGSYSNSQKVFPHIDTTVDKTNGYWLPMFHIRCKPFEWFDLRFAYTNTLTFPDFNAITPLYIRGVKYFTWNNVDLKAATSQNLDLYLSFYDNTIGLFTIGGFYKEIKNLIFQWPNRRCEDPVKLGLPAYLKDYFYTSYINNENLAHVKGVEIDWQTHFWYLPGVLSGTVLNVNYTHIQSEALYPQTRYDMVPVPGTPFFQAVVVDTFFIDRMLYQPDDIVNISLGFDYEAFSIRFSLLYTSNIFRYGSFWEELRSQTNASTRYDISIKQGLPWFGLQLFCNINNVSGTKDISIVQGNGYPNSTEHYGMTVDLGLRLRF